MRLVEEDTSNTNAILSKLTVTADSTVKSGTEEEEGLVTVLVTVPV